MMKPTSDDVIDSVVCKDIRFEQKFSRHGGASIQVKIFTMQVVASTHPARCGLTFEMRVGTDPSQMSDYARQWTKLDMSKPLRTRWTERGEPVLFEALPLVRLEP